jgi:hypothetical protein
MPAGLPARLPGGLPQGGHGGCQAAPGRLAGVMAPA